MIKHQIKPKSTIYSRNTLLICFFRNTFVCGALLYTKTNKSSLSSFIWKHHSFFGLRSNWPCQRLINKHHRFPGNAQHRFEQPERSQKLYDIIAWQTQRERERERPAADNPLSFCFSPFIHLQVDVSLIWKWRSRLLPCSIAYLIHSDTHTNNYELFSLYNTLTDCD